MWLLYHLYIDFWIPIWPNLAASAICFTLALWRTKIHLRNHHEDLKKHVTEELRKTQGEPNDTVPD